MTQAHHDAILAASNLILAAAKTLDRVAAHNPRLCKAIEAIEHLEFLETIAAKLEALAQKGPEK